LLKEKKIAVTDDHGHRQNAPCFDL